MAYPDSPADDALRDPLQLLAAAGLVLAWAAHASVLALATNQLVLALAADQLVLAGATAQLVLARAAVEIVLAPAAAELVLAPEPAHPVRAAPAVDRVVATEAEDHVGRGGAPQRVVRRVIADDRRRLAEAGEPGGPVAKRANLARRHAGVEGTRRTGSLRHRVLDLLGGGARRGILRRGGRVSHALLHLERHDGRGLAGEDRQV